MDWNALADPFVSASNWIRSTLSAWLAGLNIFGFTPAADLVNLIVFLVMAILVITLILIVAPVMMMYMTWLERKFVARLQDRIGPNRVGPFGLLQPIADMIKFFTKEDITPSSADRVLHLLAPMIVVIPVVLAFAVIPFGRQMAAVDLNVGLLYLIALGSVGTIGIFMAGFGSNNKFALIGSMRAIAQIISYEVPQILAITVIILLVGSLSLSKIIDAQKGFFGLGWFVFFIPVGPVALVVYLISATAEANRVPFDLPEAESELVAGYHTEYTGMKFALFYLAEFLNVFLISATATILFFGGWQGPGVGAIPILGVLYFFGKVILLVLLQMWFRGTLPRIRVDQLMNFAWKTLVPISLILILATGLLFPLYRWVIDSIAHIGA